MKLFTYILVMAYLFALLDWKVIQATRFTHPELKDWMHAHERTYANILRPLQWVLCTPAVALQPIFHDAFIRVEATGEQQQAISHAPRMGWNGFYKPVLRGQSYVFVSWFSWFVYYLVPSVVWWLLVRRFF